MVLIGVLAGSVGALTRYAVTGLVQERADSSFPLGTAAVNLAGAFVLGLILGSGASSSWAVAGVGFTGGLTTFSTWMVETIGLGTIPRPSPPAIINLILLAALGVACAGLGYLITA